MTLYVDLRVSQCPVDGAVRIEVHDSYEVRKTLKHECGYKYDDHGRFWWRRFAGKSTLDELKVRHRSLVGVLRATLPNCTDALHDLSRRRRGT